MNDVPEPPKPPATLDEAAQELLEHHDLQNAQIDSMRHVWDNPDNDHWDTVK